MREFPWYVFPFYVLFGLGGAALVGVPLLVTSSRGSWERSPQAHLATGEIFLLVAVAFAAFAVLLPLKWILAQLLDRYLFFDKEDVVGALWSGVVLGFVILIGFVALRDLNVLTAGRVVGREVVGREQPESATWYLRIEDCGVTEHGHREDARDCVREWHAVSEQDYRALGDGETWPATAVR